MTIIMGMHIRRKSYWRELGRCRTLQNALPGPHASLLHNHSGAGRCAPGLYAAEERSEGLLGSALWWRGMAVV